MNTKRILHVLFLTTLVLVALNSTIASAQTKRSSAIDQLRTRFPGVETHVSEDGVTTIFGRPMISAATPEKAAALFLEQHGNALGASDPQLRLEWRAALGSGKGTILAYRQYIGGVPVDHAIARVLVKGGPQHSVSYAAGRLVAQRGMFEPDQISGEAARASLRSMPDHAGLSQWSEPELVVYAGEPEIGRRAPVRAWKISAGSDRGDEPRAFSFFVNAATGRLVFARDEVYHGAPIAGRVSGMATPGVFPDIPSNPAVETPLTDLFVRDVLGNLATTDADGNFSLDGNGTEVLLSALLAGPFVEVRDTQVPPPLLTQTVGPPGPADFVFNTKPGEFTTAQVNAMVQVNRTHDFYRHYQPDFDQLDRPVTANVNSSAMSCNAFFTPVGLSVNFFASDSRCVNTAYSSVVNHEYGHFIVNRLQVPQGSFGEGFSDCVSIMMHDDPIIGQGFFGTGTFVRDTVGANEQYPCDNEIHVCGQVLAGVWWDIKLNLQGSLGGPTGLELARQLFTDWSLITLGGRFRNSAHPGTSLEVLTSDDDDGDLSNGTPHLAEICDAFAAHSLPCLNDVDCNAVQMRLSCRRGTVSASIRATPNTPLTIVLDGTAEQEVATSGSGRASVRFPDAAAGVHEVCVEGCEGSCRAVTCD
jgi:hypothetical protein